MPSVTQSMQSVFNVFLQHVAFVKLGLGKEDIASENIAITPSSLSGFCIRLLFHVVQYTVYATNRIQHR